MQSHSSSVGRFVWFELLTTDVAGAIEFYGKVVGYTTEPFGDGSMPYLMWKTPSGPTIGGVMTLPAEAAAMGAPPHWMGNLCVASVDAAVEKVKAAGGVVHQGPFDVPDIGRIAIIGDPTGAGLALYQPAGDAPGQAGEPAIGEVGWSELMSGDPEKSLNFYQDLVGWQKAGSMDMGPMGTYQMFGQSAEAPIGGLMGLPPGMPVSAWAYYLHVPDVDVAIAAAKANGGTLIHGPQEVPGGARIANLVDPQGAHFAILGK